MNTFIAKFRLVFLPFLFIAPAFIAGYTFLHWLLIIKLNLFELDEMYIELLGPMILPGIPLLIWQRPRIKLLKLNTSGSRDPATGLLLILWGATLASALIAQQYIVTATGKLTTVERVGQITQLPATKYYKVEQFYVDKTLARAHTAFKVTNKNRDFDMTIFVALPMFDRQPDLPVDSAVNAIQIKGGNRDVIVLDGKLVTKETLFKTDRKSVRRISILKDSSQTALYGKAARKGTIIVETNGYKGGLLQKMNNAELKPVIWVGKKYTKTISNSLTNEEKQSKFEEFAKETEGGFNAGPFDKFIYLDRMPYSDDLKGYRAAIEQKHDISLADVVILSPVNEPFEARNGNKLMWIFLSFTIGSVLFLIIIQFIPLREVELTKVDKKKALRSAFKDIKSVFTLNKAIPATHIIIGLNMLIFVLMVCGGLGFISFDASDLLLWGGNKRQLVLDGAYWRLITNTFLHGGIMHLLFNMYGLWFVGIFLEPLLGAYKYAVLYIVTGIVASIASIWWHADTVSVGASGAIFGMYGVFLALLTTNLFPPEFKKAFLLSTSVYIGYNLLAGLAGNIDNAAHIGGLLSGVLLGYALYPVLNKKKIATESELYKKEIEEHVQEP